jgi:hypothetical protein
MDLAITYKSLFNPAARAALGLPDNNLGVMVSSVYDGGSSEGILQPGDVLLSIDGLDISSDGTIPLGDEPVPLAEVVERKFKGEAVNLGILRGGKPMALDVPLTEPWPFTLQANAYDERPRFVVFGGLVFQPVDENFIQAHGPANQRLNYLYDFFVEDSVHRRHPELVALGNILADPVNAYAGEFRHSVVEKINGKEIKSLRDVAAAFAEPAEDFVIEFVGEGRPVVMGRKAVEEARERILARYGVVSEQNLEK